MDRFEELNQNHKEFTEKTFPDITDFRGPLRHMKEEIEEAIESGQPIEFADIQLLLLSAWRLRFPDLTTEELIDICNIKLSILKERKWGVVNSEGFSNHIK